jgi:ABC-type transport system involved in cytochrome c biogenesis permease subunit
LNGWVSPGQAVVASIPFESLWPGVLAYASLGDAYRAQDAAAFNRNAKQWSLAWKDLWPRGFSRMNHEVLFNRFQPFAKAMALYVAAFLLAVLSWLAWPRPLTRAAFGLLILAFLVHTFGLATRMMLQGRPPVTNLYSSAIFVGWAAVLFGMVLEKIFKKGLGTAAAASIGFATLIVAHHLTQQGDTLEMMRAVLDSNFWLATHVVTITIGYSSTFLSGFIGILYLLRERFDKTWSAATAETLSRMLYGIVCFSVFFSFIGTILGGIWADQSWGRFWGWDPKENGALMIVLWNAAVLHARWGKIASPRGLMGMAVFGNIITALSWFGVNMLGIGLHSYGFMQKTLLWLLAFMISQMAVITLALWPKKSAPRISPSPFPLP